MKILKFIGVTVLSFVCVGIIVLFEIKGWPAGSSLAGIILGASLPASWRFAQDLGDTTSWKTSQTQLTRGGFINADTIIRISFAYLYRIKIRNKYLLIRNTRNTGKYQPVGGVYKMLGNEKQELKNQFHVMDDDKIPIDESSRDDYRLRMENRYLRKFIERFDSSIASREKISDVGREFREELIENGILNWDKISYRYCGRHMTELRFEEHFQIYEILLADIVELIPSPEQEQDLRNLMIQKSDKYHFATAEQILRLGIDIEAGDLKEWIGDHAKKILQETEGQLIKMPATGIKYDIEL